MALEALVALKTGVDFAKSVNSWLSAPGKRDRRVQEEICIALRCLYLTPNGVLTLLRKVAAGEKQTESQIAEALIEFNDGEWQVRRAVNALDFDRLSNELGLTIATANTLNLIGSGKISIRREIQREINYYGQSRRVRPNAEKIKEILTAIERLNAEIEEIESRINPRVQ